MELLGHVVTSGFIVWGTPPYSEQLLSNNCFKEDLLGNHSRSTYRAFFCVPSTVLEAGETALSRGQAARWRCLGEDFGFYFE